MLLFYINIIFQSYNISLITLDFLNDCRLEIGSLGQPVSVTPIIVHLVLEEKDALDHLEESAHVMVVDV